MFHVMGERIIGWLALQISGLLHNFCPNQGLDGAGNPGGINANWMPLLKIDWLQCDAERRIFVSG
jgi:hypothetical protein